MKEKRIGEMRKGRNGEKTKKMKGGKRESRGKMTASIQDDLNRGWRIRSLIKYQKSGRMVKSMQNPYRISAFLKQIQHLSLLSLIFRLWVDILLQTATLNNLTSIDLTKCLMLHKITITCNMVIHLFMLLCISHLLTVMFLRTIHFLQTKIHN